MLKLVYGNLGSSCERQVERVLAELDFVQTVTDLVGAKTEINPSLNAVAEAFKRRQLCGAFVMENHEINLDALLQRDSIVWMIAISQHLTSKKRARRNGLDRRRRYDVMNGGSVLVNILLILEAEVNIVA